jgi:LacI family gluconate utilization system Gnt-I transcriptional repressor
MKSPPKMKDVARLAGVSPMTVSRAFKRDASVKESTRERVLKVAREIGYIFDSAASTLRSQKTGFVAATIPSLYNANFSETAGALSEGLEAHGLQLLLGFTGYSVAEEEVLIEQLLRRRPEALVVTGGRHTDAAREMLINADIPVVETWDVPENPIDRVVGFSNAGAMAAMVRHLAEMGHSKICFVGGDDSEDTRGADRRAGYQAAMRDLGLDADRTIGIGRAPSEMADGERALDIILDRYPDTDAIACVADPVAFGLMSACLRRGIRVPDDMRISGFGNYDIASHAIPTMTTIEPNAAQIGRLTAEIIVDLLSGGDARPEKVIRVMPELQIRNSTGG